MVLHSVCYLSKVIRLEAQVTRCKSALENTEQIEDKLKVDNRKLQREVRTEFFFIYNVLSFIN